METCIKFIFSFQFTTSVANLQPQQISTNVTVKAMTNGSLKYEPQEIRSLKMEPEKVQNIAPSSDILHDFKQEPDNEFADLVTIIFITIIFYFYLKVYVFRILEVLPISWLMTRTN